MVGAPASDFDREIMHKIAKASKSPSALKDCSFMRLIEHFTDKELLYFNHIGEIAYVVGYTKKKARELRIISIAVADEHKSRGYGSMLMRATIGYAKQHELRGLTTKTQASAVSFYKRFGFTVQGTKDGDYIMYKHL